MTSRPVGAADRFVGFDGLRLLAALAVLFSHSFIIATGDEGAEPFISVLHLQKNAGVLGVFVFFIISGFLLTRSLSMNGRSTPFVVNRALRILPGFVACTLAMGLLAGPLFSGLGRAFLTSPDVAQYIAWSIDTLGDWRLPGLFHYPGAIAPMVNGSLWSLRYEVLSYVLLLAVWRAFGTAGRVATVVGLAAGLTWAWPYFGRVIPGVAYTLPYFAGGSLMFLVHRRYGTHLAGAILCGIGLAVTAMFKVEDYAFALCGAYLVVYFGERGNVGSRIAGAIGDCSYGLYLYNWPAAQMVRQATGSTNPAVLFIFGGLVALGLAMMSCHFVERPAMRYRARVSGAIDAWMTRIPGEHLRAALIGGRIAFVASTLAILTSKSLWWYALTSIGVILLAVVGGALAGAAMFDVLGRVNRSRPSSGTALPV